MPMDPGTALAGPGEATRPILDLGMRRPGNGAAILILGSRRGDAFVADKILIGTETLGAEAAMHAWLREPGIHVTTSHREALSTDGRDPG